MTITLPTDTWLLPDGTFDDLTIDETLLWQRHGCGSYDDHPQIWRWIINDLTMTDIQQMSAQEIHAYQHGLVKLPTKAPYSTEELALLNAAGWILDVAWMLPDGTSPTEIRAAVIKAIIEEDTGCDPPLWLAHLTYVMARRETPQLDWATFCLEAIRADAVGLGANILGAWKRYRDSVVPARKKEEEAEPEFPLGADPVEAVDGDMSIGSEEQLST